MVLELGQWIAYKSKGRLEQRCNFLEKSYKFMQYIKRKNDVVKKKLEFKYTGHEIRI